MLIISTTYFLIECCNRKKTGHCNALIGLILQEKCAMIGRFLEVKCFDEKKM